MRMMSMVILVLLSMCIGIRVAHAQAEPPYWIRVLAEEESVTVRVFDIVEGRATSTGSGFVAYDDGDPLPSMTHYAQPRFPSHRQSVRLLPGSSGTHTSPTDLNGESSSRPSLAIHGSPSGAAA